MLSTSTIFLVTLATGFAFDLHLMHTNDMHSRFEQTSRESSKCTEQLAKEKGCYGGFARIRTLVQEHRQAAQEKRAPPVLFLNAGDSFQGSFLFTKYGWEITTKFVNLLELDAMSLGNHEFDNGVNGLIPFINNILTPVVTANLDLRKEPKLFNTKLLNSTIITIEGVQIGIIGYLTPDTKFLSQSGDVEFEDEIKAIQREVNSLKEKGIKIFIALGHSGWLKDLEIAERIQDIDIVVGGHTNTFLYTGEPPDIEKPVDVYPKVVVQESGRKVLVVQSFAYTKYLGSLYVTFNDQGEITNFTGNPILVDFSIKEDPNVLKELSLWNENSEYDLKMIGESLVYLENSCRMKECNLGNLITDSFIDYVSKQKTLVNNVTWTDSAIAIYHSGGIRAGFDELNGVITREILGMILPFNDSLLLVSLPGQSIWKALEWSIAKYNVNNLAGKFLQMSGIRVVYNLRLRSVTQVLIRCRKCRIPQFEPLNITKYYNLIMPEFIYKGGDNYTFKDVQSSYYLNVTDLIVLEQYIQKYSPIYPGLDGRIMFEHELITNTSSRTILGKILFFIILFNYVYLF